MTGPTLQPWFSSPQNRKFFSIIGNCPFSDRKQGYLYQFSFDEDSKDTIVNRPYPTVNGGVLEISSAGAVIVNLSDPPI